MPRATATAGGRRAASARSSSVSSASHRLRSVSIVGGFLDGVKLELSNGLNCLIGARGTGKTTVLELVRYALDALPGQADSAARRRVESLVERNLGGGRVELAIQTREGLSYIISRSAGEDPLVLTSTGEPTEIVLRAGGIFRADVYSQNEVEDIADRALSQLVLLDNFESERIAEIEGKIRSVETSLAANASRIGPLQREIVALAEEIGTLPGVEEKLKAFASVGGDDAKAINLAHQHKALRDRERRAVEGIWQYLAEYQQQLDATAGQIAGRVGALFTRDILGGPNGATLGQIRDALLECGSEVDDLLRSAQSAVERIVSNLGESGQALAGIHTQQEIQFRTLIEKHQEAQEQTLERSRLEKLRNDLLAKRRLKEELEAKLTKALREREMMLITLSEHRNHRFAIRKEVADRINAALTPTIRVTVIECGNPDAYRGKLEEALRGARLKHNQVAQKLVDAFWPADLVAAVRAQDVERLMERAELSQEQAERVIEALAASEVLFDLETVELIDLPRIELKDGDEYKGSSSLSTGQKCTAILPILLLESDRPLLIDQPEDNLDNRFIYKYIVESIRHVKKKRQLLFVTHNPNIPVLGDAERVFVLESDGATARKAGEGTVDQCKHDIVTLLEGGEEAFRERQQRYSCKCKA